MEDFTLLTFEAEPNISYSLRLYDISGQLVREIENIDNASVKVSRE